MTSRKTLCIIETLDMHSEVTGLFFQHFADWNIHCVYPSPKSPFNAIAYYEKLFKHPVTYRSKPNEAQRAEYDLVVFLTSNEVPPKGYLTKENSKNCVIVKHQDWTATPPDVCTLSFTPLVPATVSALPLYKHPGPLPKHMERKPILCVIGLSDWSADHRDVDGLLALSSAIEETDWTIRVYSRRNPKIEKLFDGKPVEWISDCDTETMVEAIRREVMFVMTLEKPGGVYCTALMTGALPLAINALVPVICTKRLEDTYGLWGAITYKESPLELLDDLLHYKIGGHYHWLVECIKLYRHEAVLSNQANMDVLLAALPKPINK